MERPPRYVSSETYLSTIAAIFGVKRIMSPGCGTSTRPRRIFPGAEITYLDQKPKPDNLHDEPRYVKAQYLDTDFPANYFDAIYFGDNDADPAEVGHLITALRPGSIVIFDDNFCPNTLDPSSFIKLFPNFSEVKMSFRPNNFYDVLQKSWAA